MRRGDEEEEDEGDEMGKSSKTTVSQSWELQKEVRKANKPSDSLASDLSSSGSSGGTIRAAESATANSKKLAVCTFGGGGGGGSLWALSRLL